MNLLKNLKTIIGNPNIAKNYLSYCLNRLQYGDSVVRILDDNIKVTGFSGFSEFHSVEGFVSSPERKYFNSLSSNNGIFFDVGANIGVVSLLLSRLEPNRKVFAFEPNPSTFKALQENIILNNFPNIQAQNLAVSDNDGEITFNADPIRRGTASISFSENQYVIKLPCITLDFYAQAHRIDKIAFLKVDVEGYEEFVFRGAKNLLKLHNIETIYYEVCPDAMKNAGLVPTVPTQMLMDYGYKIFKLDTEGNLCNADISMIDQVVCENWIALS